MPLDGPLLNQLLHGHLRLEADPAGGWRIWRHTPAQIACFDREPMWGIRCRCPAGVRLLLAPCGTWLELDWAVDGQCRSWGAVDLGPVGNPLLRAAQESIPVGPTWRIRFDLPSGWHELPLECWLPHTQAGRLLDLRSESGIRPTVPPKRRRLLALGDSITQGMVAAGPGGAWAMQLARLLDADLLNQGVGGHVFDAASFDPSLAWEPDLITVAYGTNDWTQGGTPDGIARAAQAYLMAVRGRFPDVPLLVITPLWRRNHAQDQAGGSFEATCTAIAQAASTIAGTTILDGRLLAPHGLDRMPDGVHPDEAGMGAIALGIYLHLRKTGLICR